MALRAPSIEEISNELLHEASDQLNASQRFQDPLLHTKNNAHEIKPEDIEQLKSLLIEKLLTKDNILNALGKLMTEPKYKEEFVAFPVESGIIKKRPDSRLSYLSTRNIFHSLQTVN